MATVQSSLPVVQSVPPTPPTPISTYRSFSVTNDYFHAIENKNVVAIISLIVLPIILFVTALIDIFLAAVHCLCGKNEVAVNPSQTPTQLGMQAAANTALAITIQGDPTPTQVSSSAVTTLNEDDETDHLIIHGDMSESTAPTTVLSSTQLDESPETIHYVLHGDVPEPTIPATNPVALTSSILLSPEPRRILNAGVNGLQYPADSEEKAPDSPATLTPSPRPSPLQSALHEESDSSDEDETPIGTETTSAQTQPQSSQIDDESDPWTVVGDQPSDEPWDADNSTTGRSRTDSDTITQPSNSGRVSPQAPIPSALDGVAEEVVDADQVDPQASDQPDGVPSRSASAAPSHHEEEQPVSDQVDPQASSLPVETPPRSASAAPSHHEEEQPASDQVDPQASDQPVRTPPRSASAAPSHHEEEQPASDQVDPQASDQPVRTPPRSASAAPSHHEEEQPASDQADPQASGLPVGTPPRSANASPSHHEEEQLASDQVDPQASGLPVETPPRSASAAPSHHEEEQPASDQADPQASGLPVGTPPRSANASPSHHEEEQLASDQVDPQASGLPVETPPRSASAAPSHHEEEQPVSDQVDPQASAPAGGVPTRSANTSPAHEEVTLAATNGAIGSSQLEERIEQDDEEDSLPPTRIEENSLDTEVTLPTQSSSGAPDGTIPQGERKLDTPTSEEDAQRLAAKETQIDPSAPNHGSSRTSFVDPSVTASAAAANGNGSSTAEGTDEGEVESLDEEVPSSKKAPAPPSNGQGAAESSMSRADPRLGNSALINARKLPDLPQGGASSASSASSAASNLAPVKPRAIIIGTYKEKKSIFQVYTRNALSLDPSYFILRHGSEEIVAGVRVVKKRSSILD